MGRRGRDLYDLTAEALHQRGIFTFGVTNDDVILGDQESIGDFSLRTKGLTGTRGTKDQAVRVLQFLPVHHNQIIGQCIDAIINSLFTCLEQFLGGEGHKNCHTRGSQATLNLNLIQPQRQAAYHTLLLLIVQSGDTAVVLLSNGICLEDVVIQLTLTVCSIQNQECHKEHSLISALQILQKLLCFLTIESQVRRNDVHVVTGTDCFLLLLDLGFIQIGDSSLDGFDSTDLIDGLHMQIYDNVALNFQEVLQNSITELRSQDLQETDGSILLTHHEIPGSFEVERAGCNEILGRKAGGSQPIPRETERLRCVHAEDVMEYPESFVAVQHLRAYAHSLKVVNDIGLDAFKAGLCSLQTVCINTEGEIFGLHQTVIASG